MVASLIAGLIGLAIILVLFAFQAQIGRLRTASWLVTFGTLPLLEHPLFSILSDLQLIYPEASGISLVHPHARVHFFMAGVYSLIAIALILIIAWDGLRHGSRTAWYAILGTLIIGGGSELLAGRFLYQHGSPIYRLFGVTELQGFGWAFLYLYIISWIGALIVSFRSIFERNNNGIA